MQSASDLLGASFGTLPELIRAQARERPAHAALVEHERSLSYAELDALVDRIAASLDMDGVGPGGVVAICASASIEYAAAFIGILRAGAAVAPLAPSSTPESLAAMLRDCDARLLFLDAALRDALAVPLTKVALDSDAFQAWLAPAGSSPAHVEIRPADPFNIIYSSGTTGTPKGIVQSHGMRWTHLSVGDLYTRDAVTLVSTALYSNTTLVSFLPTLANGGTVVLLPKFEPAEFLAISARHRITHAMLVPVQYRRLLEHPDFDRCDLSSYRLKFCTSAPFPAALKAEVLRRWPGGLIEFYGMTEGGGSCGLFAHEHPEKLGTVGQPLPGHDLRIIDDAGAELPPGETGEIVGRSPAMMTGYHNQPDKSAQAEWFSRDGLRFTRTEDLGAFDADGFLTLHGRKKDMIISGGFNIFPSDIEAELVRHPAVLEAAVVGVPSERWGETPIGFAVLRLNESITAADLLAWINQRLGKTQRLSDLRLTPALQRSPIGKILKRELRDSYVAGSAQHRARCIHCVSDTFHPRPIHPQGDFSMANTSQIKAHMEVIGADGAHVGTVDALEGNRIKLTKADSGSHAGHHHYVSTGLVATVEGNKVRLSAKGDAAVLLEEEKSGVAIMDHDRSGGGEAQAGRSTGTESGSSTSMWNWNKIGAAAAVGVAAAAAGAALYKRSSGQQEDNFEARLETDENVRLISSKKVEGTPVVGRNGEALGTIQSFMVDKYTGRVAYAVMSFGGTMGVGSALFPLPWPLLEYDVEKDGYALDITREQMANAPKFEANDEPEFNADYRRKLIVFYRPS